MPSACDGGGAGAGLTSSWLVAWPLLPLDDVKSSVVLMYTSASALGLVGSLLTSRWLSAVLFEVSASDQAT